MYTHAVNVSVCVCVCNGCLLCRLHLLLNVMDLCVSCFEYKVSTLTRPPTLPLNKTPCRASVTSPTAKPATQPLDPLALPLNLLILSRHS